MWCAAWQADKSIVKKTHAFSRQELKQLNFDKLVEKFLESDAGAKIENGPYVLDSDRIEEIIMLKSRGGSDAIIKRAEKEVTRYKQTTLIGFQHGEKFAGVFKGSTGQIQLQHEGTRAMAIARLPDVPCLFYPLSLWVVWSYFQISKT